eukprot:11362743-Alexandrium_andersonii.AAC.1
MALIRTARRSGCGGPSARTGPSSEKASSKSGASASSMPGPPPCSSPRSWADRGASSETRRRPQRQKRSGPTEMG